jgi:hypothetical protein
VVDDATRERLRAAISDDSAIDVDEHLARVLSVVERAKDRERPIDDLFRAIRERSR